MSVFGIDYAWGRPGAPALLAAGAKYVCRYLSHDFGKNLDAAEAAALSKAGLWIVVVWESTANRALDGAAAGAQDARDALAQAKACGMPADRPICFAVDFDASGNAGAVAPYFEGAASVLGPSRVGVYGGLAAVRAVLDSGRAHFAWQTYGWSGGVWDSRAQLRQYSNGHSINGVGCDYNTAVAADFGQWRVGEVPATGPQAQDKAEDDMPFGQLNDGKGAVAPISFARGSCKAIGFFADTGLAGPGPDGKPQTVKLRVAVGHGPGQWQTQEVTVDSTKGKTVVTFDDPVHTDSVSVQRLDGGTIPVAWDAS